MVGTAGGGWGDGGETSGDSERWQNRRDGVVVWGQWYLPSDLLLDLKYIPSCLLQFSGGYGKKPNYQTDDMPGIHWRLIFKMTTSRLLCWTRGILKGIM